MENDGTTPSEGGSRKRARRHLRARRRAAGPRPRPMWQEPLRGALYAAGGSAITLLTTWIQHWMW